MPELERNSSEPQSQEARELIDQPNASEALDNLVPSEELRDLADTLAEASSWVPATSESKVFQGYGDSLEKFSGEGESSSQTPTDQDIDFAELEALLEEAPTPLPAIDSTTKATSGKMAPDTSLSDFADLEALLAEDDSATAQPLTPLTTDQKPVSGEFEDLEKLLEDTDKETASPTPTTTSQAQMAETKPWTSARVSGSPSEQTMRVPVKHLDSLSNLVGELVVNRNGLEQNQERLRQFLDNLLYQVQQLSDVSQQMQDLYERSLLEGSLLSTSSSSQSSQSFLASDSLSNVSSG